jgi:2-isopropylmalate synthase
MLSIYDTTLRDGTQGEGVSLTVRDKLRITDLLDDLGVAFIEGGWPGSNPKDAQFFAEARELDMRNARLCAFGSTRRAGIQPQEDTNLAALVASGAGVATIFGKSAMAHVEGVLRVSRTENLAMIEDSCAFLTASGLDVIFDGEHFFDGFREHPEHALETLRAAERGGARWIVLCDTNGGSLPWEIESGVRAALGELGSPLGIHAHDDSGCAVANSLAAVRAGARMVQGTINGYGERCGNADLCAVIPDLELKMGHRSLPRGGVSKLAQVSAVVDEIANLSPRWQRPFVGRSAFAHKGGVHVAAMRRDPRSYQHVDPQAVGNRSRVIVSELSGRGNVLDTAERIGVELGAEGERADLQEIKEREAAGYAFESAEASVGLLLSRRRPDYVAPFAMLEYTVFSVGQGAGGDGPSSDDGRTIATIKVRVGARVLHTVSEGEGPVHALDGALRKALTTAFPEIRQMQLVDYKVRILDPGRATAATTRVLVESRAAEHRWAVVGASSNILEASLLALLDAFEHGLGLLVPRVGRGWSPALEGADGVLHHETEMEKRE